MHILHDMRVREGGGRGWGERVGREGGGGGRGNIKDEILTHQSTLPQPVQFP